MKQDWKSSSWLSDFRSVFLVYWLSSVIAQQSFGSAFSSVIEPEGFTDRSPWALLFQLLEKASEWKPAKKELLDILIFCSSSALGNHDLNSVLL